MFEFFLAVVFGFGVLAFLAYASTWAEPRESEEMNDTEVRGLAGALQRMFEKIGEERL